MNATETKARVAEEKARALEAATMRMAAARENADSQWESSTIVQARRFIERPVLTVGAIGGLNGHVWALIVSEKPELARYCPFEYFDANDWIMVLSACPDLAKDVSIMGICAHDSNSQRIVSRISREDVLVPYGRLAYTVLADDRSAVVTGIADYPCHADALIVPAEVDGYRVTTIRSLERLSARCATCGELAFLEIEDGVIEIDDYAFRGLSVAQLILPASVTKIGDRAFDEMSKCGEVIHGGRKMERENA